MHVLLRPAIALNPRTGPSVQSRPVPPSGSARSAWRSAATRYAALRYGSCPAARELHPGERGVRAPPFSATPGSAAVVTVPRRLITTFLDTATRTAAPASPGILRPPAPGRSLERQVRYRKLVFAKSGAGVDHRDILPASSRLTEGQQRGRACHGPVRPDERPVRQRQPGRAGTRHRCAHERNGLALVTRNPDDGAAPDVDAMNRFDA